MVETLNLWAGKWLELIWKVTWQSGILIAVVFLITKIFRERLTPTVRHLLWTLVIAKLLITPFVSVPVTIPVKARPTPPPVLQETMPIALPAETKAISKPFPITTKVKTAPVPLPELPISKAAPHLSFFLFFLWLSGAVVFFLGITIRSFRLCRQLSSAEPLEEKDILASIDCGAKELKIRSPRLKVSDRFTSPLVCGIFRPVLIIPRQILEKFQPKELESIILHELAHLKRRDILTNWFQILAQTLYFFNPLVWYVNRQIRLEREQACDDWVLQINQGERKNYADALLKVIELGSKNKYFALSIVGLSEPFISMSRRLKMVMDTGRKISTRISVKTLIVLVMAGLIGIPSYLLTVKKVESTENVLSQSVREDVIKKSLTANAFRQGVSGDIEIGTEGFLIKGKFWQKNGSTRCEMTVSGPTEEGKLVMVSDGTTLWFYNPNYKSLEKIDLAKLPEDIRSMAEKSHGIYNSAAVYEEFAKIAEVTEKTRENKKYYVLTVNDLSSIKELSQKVKESVDFKKVLVWLDSDTYLISRIEMFGVNNRLIWTDFKNLSMQPIPDSIFKYIPPPGIQITDNTDSILQRMQSTKPPAEYQTYQVNKTVADFPQKEDLSTPESAYAAVNRVMGSGDNADWRRVSASSLANRLPPPDAKKSAVEDTWRYSCFNARIIEVRIYKGVYAGVIAELASNPQLRAPFDSRKLILEKGKWLNAGEDRCNSLEEARENNSEKRLEYMAGLYAEKPVQPKKTESSATPEQPGKTVSQPAEPSVSKVEMMGRVEDFFLNNFRDVTARKSLEWGEVETQKDGSHSIRYLYEARIWDRETMTMNQIFTFDRNGNFVRYENVAGFPKTKTPKVVDITTQTGMKGLVQDFFQNNYRDITKRQTLEWGEVVKNKDGTSSIRYKYLAEIWGKDVKTMDKVFTFDSSGKFISADDVMIPEDKVNKTKE